MVTVGSLSDHKIQENDVGCEKDAEEYKPEDAVVDLVQVEACPDNREVSQSCTEHSHDISEEGANVLVLLLWVANDLGPIFVVLLKECIFELTIHFEV